MTHHVDIQSVTEDTVKAGDITFRPAYCPAVIDTATWDVGRALSLLRGSMSFLERAASGIMAGELAPHDAISDNLSLFRPSQTSYRGAAFILARLRDGQRVLLAFGSGVVANAVSGFGGVHIENVGSGAAGMQVALIPADTDNVRHFVENAAPAFGPRPMGTTPRLGVGDRMTSLVFPGAFDVLTDLGLPCNIIQNSVGRELAPMRMLLSKEPLPQTYLPGLGTLSIGHTGSSIEGLWLEGVLWGIQLGADAAPWGADADHVPVKRSEGTEGLDRAKELLHLSRDFTFFTMDTSDLFDYRAVNLEGSALLEAFERAIPDASERKALLERHTKPLDVPAVSGRGGRRYQPTEEQAMRFAVKYWPGLAAAGLLNDYIASLRGERDYDFEFSMDERPLDISALESVTPDEEVIFVLRELEARDIRTTHVAPNFGVEKGYDYRLPDGRDGLADRSARMAAIARYFGVTLDYHSGDDLSRETRQRIAESTGGVLDYKISPILQTLYAEVLADVDPERFRWWWETTRQLTEREAARGEKMAQKYLEELAQREAQEGADFQPRVDDHFFWNYCFAVVGARDENGQFLYRERFYEVPDEVIAETRKRTRDYIAQLAGDVGLV